MKKINKLSVLLLLTVIFFSSSCRTNDDSADSSNYNITFKVNGVEWKSSNGTASINDANGNANAYLLLGGSEDGGNETAAQFFIMLQGANVANGKSTIIKGGFNGGEYISLKHDSKDYVTNNAAEGVQVGEVSIVTVGTILKGTFNGVLHTETGATITITEGQFSVPLNHF